MVVSCENEIRQEILFHKFLKKIRHNIKGDIMDFLAPYTTPLKDEENHNVFTSFIRVVCLSTSN